MPSKWKGAPTADEIRENAERVYKHFSAEKVQERIGLANSRGLYYYVTGVDPDDPTEPVFFRATSEAQAREVAGRLDNGMVYELNTSDPAKAKSIIKADKYNRGASASQALKRMRTWKPGAQQRI